MTLARTVSHPSLSPSYTPGSLRTSSSSLSATRIGTRGRHFIDQHGRVLLLHGVSLSGISKLPRTPDGQTHLYHSDSDEGRFHYPENKEVSYVGRPFEDLGEDGDARRHLKKLQSWGLTWIRVVVTWEGLEHEGPGIYDTAYITYLRDLISLFPQYGMKCFIDAHQDVWSRFTGGSGAPGWTLDLAGFDSRNFKPTGAAYAHQSYLSRQTKDTNKKPSEPSSNENPPKKGEKQVFSSDEEQEDLFIPPTVWPSGYQKLVPLTMFTLFWSGDTFASKTRVRKDLHMQWREVFSSSDGEGEQTIGIQEFLQASYCEAFGRLADQLNGLQAVVGFEVMNEPHPGLLPTTSPSSPLTTTSSSHLDPPPYTSSHKFSPHSFNPNTDLHLSLFPSFLESLQAGEGFETWVGVWGRSWPVPTRRRGGRWVNRNNGKRWIKREGQIGEENGGKMTRGRRRAWKEGTEDIWRREGVWDWVEKETNSSGGRRARGEGQAIFLKYDYFNVNPKTGKEVDFYEDFYWSFCRRFSARVNKRDEDWMFGEDKNERNEEEKEEAGRQQEWFSFVGPVPNEFCPPSMKNCGIPNLVYAPHFYDLHALFSKSLGNISYNVQGLSRGMSPLKALYYGKEGLRANYAVQIRNLVLYGYRHARSALAYPPSDPNNTHSSFSSPSPLQPISDQEVPVLIGEVGVPVDMNGKSAFSKEDGKSERWKWPTRMMDALCGAMEDGGVGYCLWNYNPLNTNAFGDGWNMEDFSIHSLDSRKYPEDKGVGTKKTDDNGKRLNDGGRMLDGVARTYAVKIAGIPLVSKYDMNTLSYKLRFSNPHHRRRPNSSPATSRSFSPEPTIDSPPLETLTTTDPVSGGEERVTHRGELLARETEIFVPRYRYRGMMERGEIKVEVSDGGWGYNEELQTLYYVHSRLDEGYVHEVTLTVPHVLSQKRKAWNSEVKNIWLAAIAILLIGVVVNTFGKGENILIGG